MKNYSLPLLGFALMLLTASCKKEDVRPAKNEATTSKDVQWSSLTTWSNLKTDNATTYFSKLTDSTITAEVVNEGLVLVYKKGGSSVQSLPLQEKESNIYWYYQVSKGSLRVNSDNHSGQNLDGQLFSYFVVTPQQLSALEAKGKSKFDLLQLSYDEAVSLLK